MSRQSLKVFSVAFLDLITSFLGAVMVLFLLAMHDQQAQPCPGIEYSALGFYDKETGQLFTGALASAHGIDQGDSVLVVVKSLQDFPCSSDELITCPPIEPCSRRHYVCPPPSEFSCEDCPTTILDCSTCPTTECKRRHCGSDCSSGQIIGYMPPGKRFIITWDNPASNLDISVGKRGGNYRVGAQRKTPWGEWYNDKNRWGGKRSVLEAVKVFEPGIYTILARNKTKNGGVQSFKIWLTNDDGSRSSEFYTFQMAGGMREFKPLIEVKVTDTSINVISVNN